MPNTIINKVYGVPGAGKTTFLQEKFEDLVGRNSIAFFTFTVKAKDVMRGRLGTKYPDAFLRNIRTIHSYCYYALGMPALTNGKTWEEMKNYGYTVHPNPEDPLIESDNLLQLYEYFRHTGKMIAQGAEKDALDRFVECYEHVKKKLGQKDFTDLLYDAVEQRIVLDTDILFVDEAQDLTPLQWKLIWQFARDKKEVWIGGDPLQAIYSYAGAVPSHFTDIKATKTIILDKSHRVPQRMLDFALSLVSRNPECYLNKIHTLRKEHGEMQRMSDFESVCNAAINSNRSWFVLFRNRYYLVDFANFLKERFVPFKSNRVEAPSREPFDALNIIHRIVRGEIITYPEMCRTLPFMHSRDVEWSLPRGFKKACRLKSATEIFKLSEQDERVRRAYKLCAERPLECMKLDANQKDALRFWTNASDPTNTYDRLFISTIHGVKGDEADCVALCDAITRGVRAQLWEDPSSEHRVFYVGATRVKERFIILHHPRAYWRYAL